jgi:hypothetical protein
MMSLNTIFSSFKDELKQPSSLKLTYLVLIGSYVLVLESLTSKDTHVKELVGKIRLFLTFPDASP